MSLRVGSQGQTGSLQPVASSAACDPGCVKTSALLRLYIYGYLNRVHSSRRLEREAGRNVEVSITRTGLSSKIQHPGIPATKSIARDQPLERSASCDVAARPACARSQNDRRFPQGQWSRIKRVCARFVEVCRKMGLLATASVAIDGSKFKAVNNRDKKSSGGARNWRRVLRAISLSSIAADRQEPSETRAEHRRDETAAGGGEGGIRAPARAVAIHRARETARHCVRMSSGGRKIVQIDRIALA
ncbi:transposase [Bradyrhizobium sp. LM4.3]